MKYVCCTTSCPPSMNQSVKQMENRMPTKERGIPRAHVWLAEPDSSSLLSVILLSTFNSFHLPSVSASKLVLLPHNTAACQGWKVLSAAQTQCAAAIVHLHSLTSMPHLYSLPFMDFDFICEFVNAVLCSFWVSTAVDCVIGKSL